MPPSSCSFRRRTGGCLNLASPPGGAACTLTSTAVINEKVPRVPDAFGAWRLQPPSWGVRRVVPTHYGFFRKKPGLADDLDLSSKSPPPAKRGPDPAGPSRSYTFGCCSGSALAWQLDRSRRGAVACGSINKEQFGDDFCGAGLFGTCVCEVAFAHWVRGIFRRGHSARYLRYAYPPSSPSAGKGR